MIVPLVTVAAITQQQDVQTFKVRFYAELRARQFEAALTDGATYLRAYPNDDAFALDYAYALCNAGKSQRARPILERLRDSDDAAIAHAARAQLAALPSAGVPAHPRSVYAYAEPDSRYRDVFYGARLQVSLSRAPVAPYAVVDVNSDTRSGAPQNALVFNTDTLLMGAGVGAAVSPYLHLRVEGGPSIGLRGQASDLEMRAAATYWRENGTLNAAAPHETFGLTVEQTSRFPGDVVGYASFSHDGRLSAALRGIAGVHAAFDSKGYYYNRFAEAFAGVAVPLSAHASLQLQAIAGAYLPGELPANVNRRYTALRALLTAGMSAP